MNRFDYVKYDDNALCKQDSFKSLFKQVEALVEESLPDGRAKSLVFTYLEITYMWVGKALRDEQINRDKK